MQTAKLYIPTLVLFLSFTSVFAQESDSIPNLSDSSVLAGIPDENVDVIKAFRAKLADATRINISPVLPKITPKEKVYRYNISIVPLELRYPEPTIRPLAITADKPVPTYNFYAKAGAGTIKSLFGDIGFYKRVDNKYDLGIKVRHHSVDNSADQAFQKYNTTGLNSFINFGIADNHQLDIHLDGNFTNRFFYHDETDVVNLYSEEESKRRLSNLAGSISLSNIELTDLDLNYQVTGKTEVTEIKNQDFLETQLSLSGKVQKVRSEQTAFEISAEGTFVSGDDYQVEALQLQPIVTFNTGRLMAHLGGNFLYANEKAYPWVDIEIAIGISENFIQAFVGSDQGYLINGLNSLSKINPYIQNITNPLLTNVFKDIYGGVRGEFGVLAYSIKGGYKEIENQAMFLNGIDRRKFVFDYDDLEVPYIGGNITFHVKENLVVSGWANQNFYTAKTYDEVIHLPAFELGASGEISVLDDKINFSSSLHLADKASYLNEEGDIGQLNLLTDLNTELNVRLSENIGVWAQANNILDNKYERWQGYPSVGIHFIGGVLLKF